VRLPDALVAADEGRQRDALGRAESDVTPGAVAARLDLVAVDVGAFVRLYVPHELLAGPRVSPLAQPLEVLTSDRPRKPEVLSQFAPPLADGFAFFRVVATPRVLEFLLEVGDRPRRAEGATHRHHGLT
jgi:hypothetical protein